MVLGLRHTLLFALLFGVGATALAEKTVHDPACLNPLVERAFRDIVFGVGAHPSQTANSALAIRQAEAEVAKILRDRSEDIQEFAKMYDEVGACEAKTSCLSRVWSKLSNRVGTLKQVMGAVMGSESRGWRDLWNEAEALSKKWVDEHADELVEYQVERPDHTELTVLITERLRSEVRKEIVDKPFSWGGLFKSVVTSAGATLVNAVTALWPRALARNPVARRDLAINMTVVLSLQVTAQLLSMGWNFLTGQPIDGLEMVRIYALTVAMMFMQGESAARMMNPIEPPKVTNFDEAMRAMPAILNGSEGYWKESKQRLITFLGLLPLGFAFTTAAHYGIVAYKDGPAALDNARMWAIAMQDLIAVAIVDSYFSLRFSFFDKWFTLKLLPTYRKTTREVAQKMLDDLKIQLLVPPGWTLEDFEKFYGDGFQPTEKDEELMNLILKAKGAKRFDWLTRYLITLADSFGVMRIFGWIPKLLGFH